MFLIRATAALAFTWAVARAEGHVGFLTAAGVYVLAATWFSSWLSTDWRVQWPVLVCLLFNPLLFGPTALYRVNPELANVLVMPVLLAIQPALLPVAVVAAFACAWCFWVERDGRTELWVEKRPRLAAMLAAPAALAGVAGWLVLAAPLLAAALGTMAATEAYSRNARWARVGLIAALWAIGIEFLFSMSLQPFAAIAEVNH